MVLSDEVVNHSGKSVFGSQPQPVLDVVPDDSGAAARSQPIAWVPAPRLILHEVLRIRHLADVVVIDAGPDQEWVGADAQSGGLGQVRHVDRMCVRTRCFSG